MKTRSIWITLREGGVRASVHTDRRGMENWRLELPFRCLAGPKPFMEREYHAVLTIDETLDLAERCVGNLPALSLSAEQKAKLLKFLRMFEVTKK